MGGGGKGGRVKFKLDAKNETYSSVGVYRYIWQEYIDIVYIYNTQNISSAKFLFKINSKLS